MTRAEADRGAEGRPAQAPPAADGADQADDASHSVTSAPREEVNGEASSVAPPPAPRSGRLPRYYARLELTDEQRQQVLSIQERYSAQETELERQLNAVASERDEQLRRVLSRSQQRKLRQLEGDRRS